MTRIPETSINSKGFIIVIARINELMQYLHIETNSKIHVRCKSIDESIHLSRLKVLGRSYITIVECQMKCSDAFDIRVITDSNGDNFTTLGANQSTSSNWISTGNRMDRSVKLIQIIVAQGVG